MNTARIEGKDVARRITEDAIRERELLGITPGLAVVLVGDDAASHLYVRLKERACREAGIDFEKFLFHADTTEETVLRTIAQLNARVDIDAILVQLPLPATLHTGRVIAAIDPAKDVDGFHPKNVAMLIAGTPRIVPGLPAGIMALIRSTDVPLEGKSALVIANSLAFYQPVEAVLRQAGCVPSFAKADEAELATKTSAADVLIVAIGRAGFIKGSMLRPGAIVIDVGTNRVDNRTLGDVDAVSAAGIAGYLTPVPGGVGPVTVAMLLSNTVALCKQHHQ